MNRQHFSPRALLAAAFLLATATLTAQPEPTAPTVNLQLGTKSLRLMGYAQSTFDVKDDGRQQTNELALQRVVLMAQAQMTEKLGFFLMADVAATDSKKYLHEYYAQYDFAPQLKLRVGQFKQPFMLENIIAPPLLGNIQMNEATVYEAGIASDPLQGNTVGRDAGIMLTGDLLPAADGRPLLSYSVGLFNGSGMNTRENNSKKDLIGMVNCQPAGGVTLSTSFVLGTGHAQADDVYSDIRQGDDYRRRRWSLGAELKLKPLLLRSEYVQGWNGGTRSRGVYAETWLHLLKGLDLVAGFDYLNKDLSLSRQEQEALQALGAPFTETCNYLCGLQYWVYRQCRVATQVVRKDRRSGPDTTQWITQFQMTF